MYFPFIYNVLLCALKILKKIHIFNNFSLYKGQCEGGSPWGRCHAANWRSTKNGGIANPSWWAVEVSCLCFIEMCNLSSSDCFPYYLCDMLSTNHWLWGMYYPISVRDLGPLWAQSCFFFEDMNGQLLRLIHGSQNIEEQVW